MGIHEGSIEYSYEWRGVRYQAFQDIADFAAGDMIRDDYSGPVTVKFLVERPSNSIVMNDKWSGIPRPVPYGTTPPSSELALLPIRVGETNTSGTLPKTSETIG